MTAPPVNDQPLLLELMLQERLIDAAGIERAAREQTRGNCTLEEALVKTSAATEDAIAAIYASHLHLPLFSAAAFAAGICPALKEALPEKFARDARVLPSCRVNGTLRVALIDPTDLALLQEIGLRTGLHVEAVVGTATQIQTGQDLLYGVTDTAKEFSREAEEPQVDVGKQADEELLDLDRPIPETQDTKIIRLVNRVFLQAIKEKASDIHLEPYQKEVHLRFRIDGCLNEMPPPSMGQYVPIVSRIKILSKMDIAEKRVPQDGAIALKIGESQIDVRVSTVPTVYGEKVVMRLLNKEAVPLDLSRLGMDERQREDFVAAANSPHGLLFVTGPTGSGKSTTLYATLNLIKSPKKNILTVEDPVEYKFTGINQIQVKPQVDLTFARALRAFLRQDPDVIMVGEVRDTETAQICLRAALTGHFVLSTLHTNSALAAISRLADMGIEPFLLASTLRMVEAQRLVRRLCPKCKEPYEPDSEMRDKFHLDGGAPLFRPRGCDQCRDSGYKGRVGIYEVIRIAPSLRDMIQGKAPLSELEACARKEGMKTLFDHGLARVREGLTSLEEILTIIGE